MRLGQGLVSMSDVRALQLAAIEEIRRVAAIADQYDLGENEREAIRRAIARIENYTLAMAVERPREPNEPPPSKEPTAPPTPWWAWGLAGLLGFGLGAAAVAALSD